MAGRPHPRNRRTPDSPELVLASTSSFRRAMLEAAGLPFRAIAPEVDESAPANASPRRLARVLALAKAQAVSRRFPEALVIGADQTSEVEGRLLRKPRSRAEARRQLRMLSGRAHRLHSAVALVRQKPPLSRVEVETARLTLRHLSSTQLEAYLDTGEWEGCVGGYRIEGRGIQLMAAVHGHYHTIVGLPLIRLLCMLVAAGFPLLQECPDARPSRRAGTKP
ncbi:MAG: septum formation protein Maf [Deltaproteobacteria bacterium]|nr:septum formation protein Maf [Deltaproteobacteria bacterium]